MHLFWLHTHPNTSINALNQPQLFKLWSGLDDTFTYLGECCKFSAGSKKKKKKEFQPSESILILFPFYLDTGFERKSRTSITALLQRGIWKKIVLLMWEMGLYNCCTFDPDVLHKMEYKVVWQPLTPHCFVCNSLFLRLPQRTVEILSYFCMRGEKT